MSDTLRRLAERLANDVPRYRMTGRYGGEVRCEVITTTGVGEWVRISDVLQVVEAALASPGAVPERSCSEEQP